MGISVGLLGLVGYEIFGTNVPQQAMNLALSELKEVESVRQVVGEPITAFGERAGRGRHGQSQGTPQNKTFEREGNSHCQILFYVRGSRSEAAVRAQVVRTGGVMGFFSTMELEACYLETRQGKITVK